MADGMFFFPCHSERTFALWTKRSPRLRGQFLGADTTGPAAASRGKFFNNILSCACSRNVTYLLFGGW